MSDEAVTDVAESPDEFAAGVFADHATIRRAVSILIGDAKVAELRAFHISVSDGRRVAAAGGYYDDMDALARDAAKLSGAAESVCVIMNPIKPELSGRVTNEFKRTSGLTTDADIASRRWLFVDCDPVRPDAKSSATDAEHEAALIRAAEIKTWLSGLGWPEPIMADSGNGGHLLYRIDLPADDGGLVERVLAALDLKFSDEAVQVDLKTFNPARLVKLYGTLACKGEDVRERPHRLSRLLSTPTAFAPVTGEQLEAIAAMCPQPAAEPESEPKRRGGRAFDLDSWIREHGLNVIGPKPWKDGRKWIFPVCPWNPAHTNRAAYIVQFGNGAVAAGCHHKSCAGKDWHALRDVYEPKWREESAAGLAEEFPLTDYGNAQRLVARHGENLRYCYALKDGWLAWTGRRWREDKTGHVMRLAKKAVRLMLRDAMEDGGLDKELIRHAMRSESAARLEAMVRLAQSEPGIPVTLEELDRDPWLFNCLNGTIDLKTGELRPHRKEDLITKIAPVEYDPAARLPLWDDFLDFVTNGDKALEAFLRRMVGYSLTGVDYEKCLFLLIGGTDTGKSTFLEAVRATLGDYAAATDSHTFLARKSQGPRNDLARLARARMVTAVETGDGGELAVELIKWVTGGDTVVARFLYAEFFEFRPAFKIWIGTNHAPRVDATDDAAWSRIHRIPFERRVPPEKKNPAIKRQLSDPKVAGAAILAWAVRGCLEWQREGIGVPPVVRQATQTYREDQDKFGEFYADCCEFDPRAWEATSRLYDAYCNWAHANNVKYLLSKRSLAKSLEFRGCVQETRGHAKTAGWRGIGLRAVALD